MSGLVTGQPLWAHYLGSIFGQFLYRFLFLPLGPLAAVGLFFLVVWPLLLLAGVCIGFRVRTRATGL